MGPYFFHKPTPVKQLSHPSTGNLSNSDLIILLGDRISRCHAEAAESMGVDGSQSRDDFECATFRLHGQEGCREAKLKPVSPTQLVIWGNRVQTLLGLHALPCSSLWGIVSVWTHLGLS